MLSVAGGQVTESSGCLVYSPRGDSSSCVTICSSSRRLAVSTDGHHLYTVCELLPPLDSLPDFPGLFGGDSVSPGLVESAYAVFRYAFVYSILTGETTVRRTELATFESASLPQRIEWPHVVMADSSRRLLPAN